jgi:hypothetical protein
MAHQFRMVYRYLDRVGCRQPSCYEYTALRYDAPQEVDQELNVEFTIVGDGGFVRSAPTQKIGSVDSKAARQKLAGWSPLLRVVSWAETVQKNDWST